MLKYCVTFLLFTGHSAYESLGHVIKRIVIACRSTATVVRSN